MLIFEDTDRKITPMGIITFIIVIKTGKTFLRNMVADICNYCFFLFYFAVSYLSEQSFYVFIVTGAKKYEALFDARLVVYKMRLLGLFVPWNTFGFEGIRTFCHLGYFELEGIRTF